MIRRRLLLVIALFMALLSVSCRQKSCAYRGDSDYRVEYATGFTVNRYEEYTEVRVRNPWDTTKYLQHYVLVDRSKPVPDNLPEAILVKVPLQQVVVCVSVHCSMLEMLNAVETITGVCESRYIALDFIQERLKQGGLVDIGEAASPDIERLVELSPDAMITSPLSSAPYGRVEKTGIPQVKCLDYMESTPLGRAEWIRFLGLFFGQEELADSLFTEIKTAYEEVKLLVKDIEKRPSVITEKKYGPMWYVPGGQSYLANIFRDAAVDYAWYDDEHSGSLALSFETVLEKSGGADYWLIKYNQPKDIDYRELKSEYLPYSHFAAFKNRNIFVCNTGEVAYYEEVPVRPDYLLKDFIKIFHPKILPDYELRYYKPMQ